MLPVRLSNTLPSWKSALLSLLGAILLVLAFPDHDYWFLAWVAFIPFIWAIDREKVSAVRGYFLGWIFGTAFFFGACWWLTYALVHYGGIPTLLAYLLMSIVFLAAGTFSGLFGAILATLLKRFGPAAILSAPFVWIFTELLRYWIIGTSWDAVAYSQAFGGWGKQLASIGGIYLTGFFIVGAQAAAFATYKLFDRLWLNNPESSGTDRLLPDAFTRSFRWPFTQARLSVDDVRDGAGHRVAMFYLASLIAIAAAVAIVTYLATATTLSKNNGADDISANVVTVQPNVPMSGLDYNKWKFLRERQVQLAEIELTKLRTSPDAKSHPTLVIFPESPMNYMYSDDPEFQAFIRAFAQRNNVSVLFNSAEPDASNKKYFNSAVMVDANGDEVVQYDKIYLVPFGEAAPGPLENVMPVLVGSFSYGKEYDLFPVGDAKAGVMLCFESAFGDLSRQFVLRGADLLIEMTNDGYLGPTPVLRQHLANSVFRAVETDRPVLRTTNVGITGYINERGDVLDPSASYREETRIWTASRSDGGLTFYVRYGDWFAWLCTAVTIILLAFAFGTKKFHPVGLKG